MMLLVLDLLPDNVAFSQEFSPLSTSTSGTVSTALNNNNSNIKQANNIQGTTIITRLLANNLESRLQNVGAVLNITSKLPEVNNTSFAYLLNKTLTTLHGIPKDADIQKRQVAQSILSNYKDLQVVFFLMPNGNIYLKEPYSRQQNSTTNNLAFRHYFQVSVKTHNIYLGNVITSTSSSQREAVITVPIYSGKDHSTLIGIWIGGIHFNVLSKELQSLNLPPSERVVYVDHNGQKLADSNINSSNKIESFANLQSFKSAINGKSGLNIEEVMSSNNMTSKILINYHPVKAFQNTWAVLLMQKAK